MRLPGGNVPPGGQERGTLPQPDITLKCSKPLSHENEENVNLEISWNFIITGYIKFSTLTHEPSSFLLERAVSTPTRYTRRDGKRRSHARLTAATVI